MIESIIQFLFKLDKTDKITTIELKAFRFVLINKYTKLNRIKEQPSARKYTSFVYLTEGHTGVHVHPVVC